MSANTPRDEDIQRNGHLNGCTHNSMHIASMHAYACQKCIASRTELVRTQTEVQILETPDAHNHNVMWVHTLEDAVKGVTTTLHAANHVSW